MPDIVLTDWAMPIFDGLELAQMIRQPGANANPYVPIIMLTGHSEKKRARPARDAGITEFMAKPISAKALYQRILNVVANPRPFIKTKTYFGPDRRRNVNSNYVGPERRKGGKADVLRQTPARQGQDRRLRPVRERPMSQAKTRSHRSRPMPTMRSSLRPTSCAERLRRSRRTSPTTTRWRAPSRRWRRSQASSRADGHRVPAARPGAPADESQRVNKTTREALFLAAHDIKGEASTFGFPWIATLADSLCRLIEHTPDMSRIPFSLVDQHVDAVRAIFRESARPDVATLADALGQKLREVTDEFLAHENRDRPDYLDGILAPPLAPGESF